MTSIYPDLNQLFADGALIGEPVEASSHRDGPADRPIRYRNETGPIGEVAEASGCSLVSDGGDKLTSMPSIARAEAEGECLGASITSDAAISPPSSVQRGVEATPTPIADGLGRADDRKESSGSPITHGPESDSKATRPEAIIESAFGVDLSKVQHTDGWGSG